MKKYTVWISNHETKKQDLLEVWEMEREHIASHDMKNIITGLFGTAAEGIQNKFLTAEVMIEKAHLFTVKPETIVDGSRIHVNIFAQRPGECFRQIRRMVLAE